MTTDNLPYTALFCEENIWQLAQRLMPDAATAESAEVVFISNPQQHVALRAQKAGPEQDYMVWDYHVILMDRAARKIYDFDSRLSFPHDIDSYFEQTLPVPGEIVPDYLPQFRCIPLADFVRRFSSDRSHMVGVIPPEQFPSWPKIHPEDAATGVTLAEYRDMQRPLDGTRRFDIEGMLDYVKACAQG